MTEKDEEEAPSLLSLMERLERIEAKLDRLLNQTTYTVTWDQICSQVKRRGLTTK